MLHMVISGTRGDEMQKIRNGQEKNSKTQI